MAVRLLDARLRGTLIEARAPFRFGIAEMREIVHLFLFATVEVDGRRVTGVAAENLPPKWFTKDPETSYRAEVEEMVHVVENACASALESGSRESVFALWEAVYGEQVGGGSAVPPLLASFGVSLVERTLIDAFCRARSAPFAQAVRANDLGVRLGNLHLELAGCEPRELLPGEPLRSVTVRHTVGLGDPLTGDDGGAGPADGLPSSLAGWIGRCGLRRFKLKVSGERLADLDRLERIGEVLARETRGDYGVTLDGNEQFASVAALRAFWEELAASGAPAGLARRVGYVEQPLPRHLALGEETAAALAAWPGRPRLTIDESDDSLDAVVRAIAAGYDGGAFKSSKGVFKGIGNACRLEQLRREQPGRTLVYSAEDLSTVGPVGLLADLAVIATLGIDEPERNGYHYLRGAGLPRRAHEETLRHHGDLFSRNVDGCAALAIREGTIDLASVVAAPFGVAWACDLEEKLDAVDAVVSRLR